MKLSQRLLSIFLLLAVFCQLQTVVAKPSDLDFIQCPWKRDGRQWKPCHYYVTTEEGLIQYLPDGDTSDAWHEMIATQWYEDARETPTEYFNFFMKELRNKIFPNSKLTENIVKKTNLALTAEWWTEGDQDNPRYGLIKIFSLYPHIYTMSYTTRDVNKITNARTTWMPIIENAYLIYSALENVE